MKILIENFGPVERFEFDTDKSMHLIVGDNNVGKSYSLTAYYFAIKALLSFQNERRNYYFYDAVEEVDDALEAKEQTYYSRFKEKKTSDLLITDIVQDVAASFVKDMLADKFTQLVKSSFYEFESIANQFSGSEVSRITFTMRGLTIVLEGGIEEFKVCEVDFGCPILLRTVTQNRAPLYNGATLVIYRKASHSPDHVLAEIKREIVKRVSRSIITQTSKIVDINYLPASRSGLYQALSAFGLIVAELSKSRSLITSKIELPGISGQLSDYFIKLTSIVESKAEVLVPFEEIAAKIEGTVLKGKIEYDYEKKKLYYTPDNTSLRLDLSATSSMVSEIGPVVTYIRHILTEGMGGLKSLRSRSGRFLSPTSLALLRKSPDRKQILIIEEPEAHLHPLNQIKMTELYAELTKIGVIVVMTSHSNYVFNKVSNLVMSGSLSPNLVRCDLFDMGEGGSSGLAQEIDEYGIDDRNFVDASELLLNEKLFLLDKVGS